MKDAILVEQTLAGDHQAFNGLIKEYYADIYAIILSWVKNPEDAKDLAQEVFISAYQKLPSIRQPQQFYLWLRQIAKRRCQNWQRNRQDNFAILHDDLISKEPSTDEVLILRETLAKVMEAIDKLPESEKLLLKEHYIDDVSYDELSARHGISAKALVVRLVRARRKIKDQLEKTLSVFVAFFHDHTESILTGGTEIVKLSVKTKLIVGGVAIMLAAGGIGIFYQQSIKTDMVVGKQVIKELIKTSEESANLHSDVASLRDNKTQNNTPKSLTQDISMEKSKLTPNEPENKDAISQESKKDDEFMKWYQRMYQEEIERYKVKIEESIARVDSLFREIEFYKAQEESAKRQEDWETSSKASAKWHSLEGEALNIYVLLRNEDIKKTLGHMYLSTSQYTKVKAFAEHWYATTPRNYNTDYVK